MISCALSSQELLFFGANNFMSLEYSLKHFQCQHYPFMFMKSVYIRASVNITIKVISSYWKKYFPKLVVKLLVTVMELIIQLVCNVCRLHTLLAEKLSQTFGILLLFVLSII